IAPAARVAVVFGQIRAEASGPGKDPEPGQGTAAVPEVGPASGPGNGAAAWPEKGRHGGPGDGPAGFTPLLGQQMTGLAAVIAPGVPAPVVARGLIAWTQLFGMISFELFGQFVGTADPADEFFGYAVDQMATLVGLD
ncbi:MAG: TetR-like C-terminal domain-containing protein, partial [Streptosporangiaceae bacterium]